MPPFRETLGFYVGHRTPISCQGGLPQRLIACTVPDGKKQILANEDSSNRRAKLQSIAISVWAK